MYIKWAKEKPRVILEKHIVLQLIILMQKIEAGYLCGRLKSLKNR
jgi:hypothetical protein